MEPLLAALGDDPWRRRGAWLAIAAVALTLAALAWSLARQRDLEAERAAMLCAGAERDLEGRWGAPQRQAIAAAFDATGLPYAAHVRDRVIARLDGFAEELAGTYRAACEEHRRGDLTDNLYERAQTCVDGAALTPHLADEGLRRGRRRRRRGAIKALDSLPRLEICRDRQALGAQVLPPQDPEIAAAVLADRAIVTDARAELAARKIPGCEGRLAPLTARARELAYSPHLADTLLVDSLCRELSGAMRRPRRSRARRWSRPKRRAMSRPRSARRSSSPG
ncbi:MAG: hypothetical protein H6710_07155 [Myxococcales bacterium]|nr:hypothetical protein [Myxococcales bacterium]